MREPVSAGQIDVVTGAVRITETDVTLPGVLPLVLRRTHLSNYRMGGAFGPSWAGTLDLRVEVDAGGARLITEDGSVVCYPQLAAVGAVYPEIGQRWPMEGNVADGLRVTDPSSGITWHFARPPGDDDPSVGEAVLPIAAITHRCGDRIDVVVDAAGRVRDLVHSGGYRIAVDWDTDRVIGLGLRESAGTAVRQLVELGYTAGGPGGRLLTEVVDPTGAPVRYTYDRAGRMTRWTDRLQRWHGFDYDANGRCVATTGTGGFLASGWEYEDAADGGVTTVTDALGHKTRYELDEFGHIVRIVDPGGGVRLFEWDGDGRLRSDTDQTGATTRYTYDERGNLIETRCADGTRETVGYDDQDRPVTWTDAVGGTTTAAYDERGNVVRLVDPTGATTCFDYDQAGHLCGLTDPGGTTSTVRCDLAGLPVEIGGPAGNSVEYQRDDAGRVVRIVGAVGAVGGIGGIRGVGGSAGSADPVELTYTDSGLLASRRFPGGAVETMEYDPCGNLVAHTAVTGEVTRYEYTAFDRISAKILPDGERLTFEYDQRLYLVKVTNQQGQSWAYRYDPCGYLIGETDFDGRELGYANDLAGRLIARTDGLRRTTYYVRDAAGRVVTQQAPEGHTGYTYDPMGRLVRARSDTVDLTRTYDRVGNLIAETVDGRTIQFGYDSQGRRTSRTTPTGLVSTWTYPGTCPGIPTGSANPTSLTLAGQPPAGAAAGPQGGAPENRPGGRPITSGRTITFGTDAAGRLAERRMATDSGWLCLRYTHDSAGRLVTQTLMSVTATMARAEQVALGLRAGRRFPGAPRARHCCRVLAHRDYGYRPDGLLHSTSDHRDGRRILELDQLGRVGSVTGTGWTERYTYRSCGSPATATWPATVPADPVVDGQRGEREYRGSRLIRAGLYTYEYDDNGRVVRRYRRQPSGGRSTWQYAWDSEDRLVGVQTPDGTRWSYRYDPVGRRLGKYRHSPDGRVVEQIDFTWDGDCLAEQAHYQLERPGGPIVTTWDHLPGGNVPVTQTERRWLVATGQPTIDERTYLVITDPAGGATELVDAVEGIVWWARTNIWGTPVALGSAGSNCLLRRPGQYHDQETGHVYANQRYLDLATARYLSQSPFGLASTPDPSGYVTNPTSEIDPLGAWPIPVTPIAPGQGRLLLPGPHPAGPQPAGPQLAGLQLAGLQLDGSGDVGPSADLRRLATRPWPAGGLLSVAGSAPFGSGSAGRCLPDAVAAAHGLVTICAVLADRGHRHR